MTTLPRYVSFWQLLFTRFEWGYAYCHFTYYSIATPLFAISWRDPLYRDIKWRLWVSFWPMRVIDAYNGGDLYRFNWGRH